MAFYAARQHCVLALNADYQLVLGQMLKTVHFGRPCDVYVVLNFDCPLLLCFLPSHSATRAETRTTCRVAPSALIHGSSAQLHLPLAAVDLTSAVAGGDLGYLIGFNFEACMTSKPQRRRTSKPPPAKAARAADQPRSNASRTAAAIAHADVTHPGLLPCEIWELPARGMQMISAGQVQMISAPLPP